MMGTSEGETEGDLLVHSTITITRTDLSANTRSLLAVFPALDEDIIPLMN